MSFGAEGDPRRGLSAVRRLRCTAVQACFQNLRAASLRLEQLSHAKTLLIDLPQTRIQSEIQRCRGVLNRRAKLLSLGDRQNCAEALYHSGAHVSPLVMLVSIPIVLGTVSLAIVRVKHALETID